MIDQEHDQPAWWGAFRVGRGEGFIGDHDLGRGADDAHRIDGADIFDGRDLSRSRVEIAIDPRSVATGKQRVDVFLRSDAVFNAPPERRITFRSARVSRTGATAATVAGALTARGTTHDESFRVELGSLKGRRIAFHVTGRVLRSRYGMDVGTPIYSNVVDFDMTLAGDRN